MKPYPNPAWSTFEVGAPRTVQIDDGLYVFDAEGVHSLFMVTDEGVIATDPISPRVSDDYVAAIRAITDKPIKVLVYSHSHWDHILGGQAFRDAGAEIVAHEKCVAHFEDLPHPDLAMPDTSFSGNHTIELGGRTLELLYLGVNHSDCMVVMRPDGGKYLYVVDLVTPGGVPPGNMADNVIHHWLRSLKEIEAMDYEVLIPSHGALLAHPSAVTERIRYTEALLATVKGELEAGGREGMMGGQSFKANVREKMKDFAYMRNFDREIDPSADRLVTYYGIGW